MVQTRLAEATQSLCVIRLCAEAYEIMGLYAPSNPSERRRSLSQCGKYPSCFLAVLYSSRTPQGSFSIRSKHRGVSNLAEVGLSCCQGSSETIPWRFPCNHRLDGTAQRWVSQRLLGCPWPQKQAVQKDARDKPSHMAPPGDIC